ncbi:MAG: hypothetical protein AB7G51_00970 [Steroidobacteraceae bacterium]
MLAVLLWPCLSGLAVATEWSDVEGRVQYAWFTGDLRALSGVVASLDGGSDDDALRAYYRGFGEYRIAQLAQGRDEAAAKAAAEACVDHLAAASRARKDFADALALQAACQALVVSLKAWKAPLLGPRSAAQLQQALALAPRNPRVMLLGALADRDRDRALGTLRKATAAFEEERRGVGSLPAWGAADAYVQMARRELDRGDLAAARSALERALLLAPEFEQARRLLATITSN